jgi:hypothetical protein
MWDRLVLTIDQFKSGQNALKVTKRLARATGAEVRVLRVRQLSKWARVPPLETPSEAESFVDEGVFSLRLAGVGADGRTRSS